MQCMTSVVAILVSFVLRLVQQAQKEQQNGSFDPYLLTDEVKMLKEEEEQRTTQELANFPQVLII